MLKIINLPMLKIVSSPLVSLKVGNVMSSHVFGVKHVRIRLVNKKKNISICCHFIIVNGIGKGTGINKFDPGFVTNLETTSRTNT